MQEHRPGRQAIIDNELDIRGLFRSLWQGKLWIVGIAVIFSLVALLYTFLPDKSGVQQLLPIILR